MQNGRRNSRMKAISTGHAGAGEAEVATGKADAVLVGGEEAEGAIAGSVEATSPDSWRFF
jgi:hypothetical protein